MNAVLAADFVDFFSRVHVDDVRSGTDHVARRKRVLSAQRMSDGRQLTWADVDVSELAECAEKHK